MKTYTFTCTLTLSDEALDGATIDAEVLSRVIADGLSQELLGDEFEAESIKINGLTVKNVSDCLAPANRLGANL